jgi:phosphonate transport system permease protein
MTLAELHRQRPQNHFVRGSALAFVGLVLWSWGTGAHSFSELATPRALRNLGRFLGEIQPTLTIAWWREAVPFAAWSNTLALAVAAVGLSTAAGAALSLGASRNLAHPEPWLPSGRPPSNVVRLGWHGVVGLTRLFLTFLRAIPEYVWAFLLVALLGIGPWPAVLALALHNSGILGKLFAEATEDIDPAAARALRGVGATRLAVFGGAVLPQVANRWLLYVFVRWETAVREATVVGLLGVVSLGWFIQDARSRMLYDEMLALVLAGAILIGAGDALSIWLRARIRAR